MKTQIKVFSKNNCPQCTMTKRFLTEHEVVFEEINIDEQPDHVATLVEAGFQAVPVVMTANESFSGFRPDRLKELVF